MLPSTTFRLPISEDESKWMRFFWTFMTTLVVNITSVMSEQDPDKACFLSLLNYTTVEDCMQSQQAIMETFYCLCNRLDSVARANSYEDQVTATFMRIVGTTDMTTLLNFTYHLNDYFMTDPTMSIDMINSLYGLRNYHLLRQELIYIFEDVFMQPYQIEDRLPQEFLQMLGLTPLFPGI